MSTWSCANCERQGGHLETPYEWGDNIVCGACLQILSVKEPAASRSVPLAKALAPPDLPRWLRPPYLTLSRLVALIAVPVGIFLIASMVSLPMLLSNERTFVPYYALGPRPGWYQVSDFALETFVSICLSGLLAFVPWFIAWHRRHPNSRAIFMLCMFASWTFVGWIVALVWAVMARPTVPVAWASKA